MTEENFKTGNSSLDDSKSIIQGYVIKINQQIRFTKIQIENLLKLQLLNMDAQKCVSSVASVLNLGDIEVNNLNFWLADTLAGVTKNIQQKGIQIVQGNVILCWFIHYVSLVIDEKLSKAKLFENLCECVKMALTNVDAYNTVALPNHMECLMKYERLKNASNDTKFVRRKTESRITMPVDQIMKIITNMIRDTFLDDFKYAVVQTAFDTEPTRVRQLEYVIKDVPPVCGAYDDHRENDLRCKVNDIHDRCRAITDRYFLRDTNDQLSANAAAGIEQLLLLSSSNQERELDILPLSAASLDNKYKKNTK